MFVLRYSLRRINSDLLTGHLTILNTVLLLPLSKVVFSKFLSLLSKRNRLDSIIFPLRTSVREKGEAPPYTVISISSLYCHSTSLRVPRYTW